MAAKAERNQTTSTVKENPVRAVQNVEKVNLPEQQSEADARDKMTRSKWIKEAAYYKAKARNFEFGNEQEDWLEAETEYKTLMEKQ